MKIKNLLMAVTTVATLGAIGTVSAQASAASSNPVYRLYNPNTGEHFYTQSVLEETNLNNNGWSYEGTGWFSSTNGTPIYRVYNPNAQGGDHYYTMSKYEAQSLVSKGWRWDNNGKAAFYSGGVVNNYVAYNANAQSGSHNYTTSSYEQNSLLRSGWKYGKIAWKVEQIGNPNTPNPNQNPKLPNPQSAPRKVDINITGDGGNQAANPGSFRYLYANKNLETTPSGTPTISVSADVKMNGNSDGSELQFVVAGSNNPGGQIGIELHNNASGVNQMPYWKNGINVAAINFSRNAGSFGQQYYSSVTSAPSVAQGQTVHVIVNYYGGGMMQTFINGSLVGQYKTSLSGSLYVIHATANASNISVSNLTVLKNGKKSGPANGTKVSDVTGRGVLY